MDAPVGSGGTGADPSPLPEVTALVIGLVEARGLGVPEAGVALGLWDTEARARWVAGQAALAAAARMADIADAAEIPLPLAWAPRHVRAAHRILVRSDARRRWGRDRRVARALGVPVGRVPALRAALARWTAEDLDQIRSRAPGGSESLDAALATLPPTESLVLRLHRDGARPPAIARILGIPPHEVARRYRRGIRLLLAREG